MVCPVGRLGQKQPREGTGVLVPAGVWGGRLHRKSLRLLRPVCAAALGEGLVANKTVMVTLAPHVYRLYLSSLLRDRGGP